MGRARGKRLVRLELTAEQKRALATELATAYPVRLVCQVLELPCSSFLPATLRSPVTTLYLKAAIGSNSTTWPTYAYQ